MLPQPTIWTEEDESELHQLLWLDMPLLETYMCVAAKQMDVATANNLEHLEGQTHNKQLQSLATF